MCNTAPSIDMTTDPIFQSKLFSGAMGPSNIQPYYYRATKHIKNEDIGISTIVTSDRFPVLSRLASRYQGKRNTKMTFVGQKRKKKKV